MDYLVLKSLHLIAVISWMAGLFYLPRLLVYHAEADAALQPGETFKVMERRLFKAIMNPAAIATWVFGIWLVVLNPDWLWMPWFMIKFAAVCVLTIFHHALGRWVVAFAAGRNRHSGRFFRIVNELPTLALLVIIPMVIIKPF